MNAGDNNRDDAAVVNPAVLQEICGGDAAFERKILANFRRVLDEDAVKLREAIAASDLAQVKRVSHSIKGASRTVGAGALAAIAERIEQASRADEWDPIRGSVAAFDLELERVCSHIDSLTNPVPAGRKQNEEAR